jgi:hypothetical protein
MLPVVGNLDGFQAVFPLSINCDVANIKKKKNHSNTYPIPKEKKA